MTRKCCPIHERLIAVIALAAILSIGTIVAVVPQQALATDKKNDKEFKKDDGGDKNINTGKGGNGGNGGLALAGDGGDGGSGHGGSHNGNGVKNDRNGNGFADGGNGGNAYANGGDGGNVLTGSSHKTDKCTVCSS